jgi:hypothetical protein
VTAAGDASCRAAPRRVTVGMAEICQGVEQDFYHRIKSLTGAVDDSPVAEEDMVTDSGLEEGPGVAVTLRSSSAVGSSLAFLDGRSCFGES